MFSRIPVFQLTFFKDKRRLEDELDLMENEIMEALKTIENGSTPGPYSLHVERTSFSGLTHRILFLLTTTRRKILFFLKARNNKPFS